MIREESGIIPRQLAPIYQGALVRKLPLLALLDRLGGSPAVGQTLVQTAAYIILGGQVDLADMTEIDQNTVVRVCAAWWRCECRG
jgi:hypothetical protein